MFKLFKASKKSKPLPKDMKELNDLFVSYFSDLKDELNHLQDQYIFSSKNLFEVKLLKKEARFPTIAHNTDAGYDLYAPRDFNYKFTRIAAQKGAYMYIDTGVCINIKPGFVGLVCPRSSMSLRSLPCALGVIDAGYQGSIKVMFPVPQGEHQDNEVIIKRGDRIAQVVFVSLPRIALAKVEEFSDTTERGQSGCGSTGR